MQIGVRDAARLLRVSEKTIYRWLKDRRIPACRINDHYRFNRAELLEWATSERIAVSPSIFHEEGEDSEAPPASLHDALQAGGIFYRVGGADKGSALREVAQLLRLPPEVDREYLLEVLLARESLGSTAIGDGIAIPHVRNPIVMHIERPMACLCFLERPVDFGALDGQPVGTLFTIISPTVRAHLRLLSQLAYALRWPPFRAALSRQALREEILSLCRVAENPQARERADAAEGEAA